MALIEAAASGISVAEQACLQDDIYQPNFYLSLLEFRELTLQRLKKFTDQRFFSTADYIRGMSPTSHPAARAESCCCPGANAQASCVHSGPAVSSGAGEALSLLLHLSCIRPRS